MLLNFIIPLNLSKYPFLFPKYPPTPRARRITIIIIQVMTGIPLSQPWEQQIWVEVASLEAITLPEHFSAEQRLPDCCEQVDVDASQDPRQHRSVSRVVLISPVQVSSEEHSVPARSEQNFWQEGSFISIRPFPSLSKLSSQVLSGFSQTPFFPAESVTVSPRHVGSKQFAMAVQADSDGLQQVSPARQESVDSVSPASQEVLHDPPSLTQSPIGVETVFDQSEKRMNAVSFILYVPQLKSGF